MHPKLRSAVPLCALLAAACASATTGPAAPRRDVNVLTADEMEPLEYLTVYEAIRRLRPIWLTDRGVASIEGANDRLPSVMIDGLPRELTVLTTLRAGDVFRVRYVSGADATTMYGTGHVNGVIEVTMRGAIPRGWP